MGAVVVRTLIVDTGPWRAFTDWLAAL